MPQNMLIFIALISLVILSCTQQKPLAEIQITHDKNKNTDLDGRYNFSPDDTWLVYDKRKADGGIDGSVAIEKINIETGEVVRLYETKNPTQYGPGVGAPSYHHSDNKTIFIHGRLNCDAEKPYAQWRRTGVIIDESNPGVPIYMDARDVTPPFTPGALRGGTHQHEWSGDGEWIGYTYNDAVMQQLEAKTGERKNLRTIGVSKVIHPVSVDKDPSGENNDGSHFSVLVVRVVPQPSPGSDEIEHANDDSWIGDKGYQKEDGSWQRARAFIGTVRDKNDEPVRELFVVDIPEKIDIPGEHGPLEGTVTQMPQPPLNTVQRRLTFSAGSKFPGVLGFTRCSSDGKSITYRAKDKDGVLQVFLLSPKGGDPQQITFHETDVQSDVRWSPDDSKIYYICDNSIFESTVAKKGSRRLMQKSEKAPTNIVLSHDGKTIGFNRTLLSDSGLMKKQVFVIKL
jgi:hypothetical protein